MDKIKIMMKNKNKWIFVSIKILLTFLLFFFLLQEINFETVKLILQNLNTKHIVFCFFMIIVQLLIQSYRWYLILKWKRLSLSLIKCLSILWSGHFFNQVLPTSIGGDMIRCYLLNKNKIKFLDSLNSILIDRIIGVIGLLVIMIFSLPFLISEVGFNNKFFNISILCLMLIIFLAGLFFLDKFIKQYKSKFYEYISKFSIDLRKLSFSNIIGIKLMILSLMIHLFSGLAFANLAFSMQIEINWLPFFSVICITNLLVILPISISGWGIRETILVVGLGLISISKEEAITLSILYGILLILSSLPGLLTWLSNVHK